MLTGNQIMTIAAWAAIDVKLNDLYASIDTDYPVRVVITFEARKWVVELRREFFEGQSRVFARRLKLEAEANAV